MTITTGILHIFRALGRDLIPIATTDPFKHKRPLGDNWQNNQWSHEQINEYVATGHNLGFRMGPTDCVIDVDPRNGGDAGLAALLADSQAADPTIDELEDIFPTVNTGGGGKHFYTSIPAGPKVLNSLGKYGKGVEFKALGRQVIIPGSTHPSGGLYMFDELSPFDRPSPPMPNWLYDTIRRDAAPQQQPSMLSADGSELTNEQLKQMLAQIDPADFASDEEWFPLMAASHEATQGAGLNEFLNWSLSDPAYMGHDSIIRARWASFQTGKGGNIGAGTLFKQVIQAGGTVPGVSASNVNLDHLGELPPAPPSTTQKTPIRHTTDLQQLQNDIAKLTLVSTPADIKAVLSQVCGVDTLDQEYYLTLIRDCTNRPLTVLKKALKQARIKRMSESGMDIEDMALEITTYLLQKQFENGAHLVHGADQQYWVYGGTHWAVQKNNIIEQYILKAAFQYRQKNPHLVAPIAGLISQGEKILRARRASENNLNEAMDGRPAVVNTRNCEVWICGDTGNITTREHSPDSWLTSCLNVDFDPAAKCPEFSNALLGMFAKAPDSADVIRHLWEIIGYVIQPQKDIAAWVLLHGEGSNGKTVVLNVLKRLLGKAALCKSIDELDVKRNNHAFADLPNKLVVIDEDLDTKTLLPDGTLKKVSENKMLTANPKNRPSFDFLNTAIMMFASNEYPRVKDLSRGMRRRAQVFNFNRIFEDHEQDKKLGKRVMDNEMGGVLVEALKGFKRLRERGDWDTPESCKEARDQWLIKSNTITEFTAEMVTECHGARTQFGQLFNTYKIWCTEQGYTKPHTKPSFRKAIEALGFKIGNSTGNALVVFDKVIKPTEFDMGVK